MKIKSILFTLLLGSLILSACTTSVEAEQILSAEIASEVSGALSSATSAPAVEEISEFIPVEMEMREGQEIADGRVLIYNRSGGFAGVSEEWIIYADGTIIAPDGTAHQVETKQVQAIVDKTGGMNVKDSYVAKNNCCDHFNYKITYFVEGELKSVSTVDGAKQPAELTAVLDDLGQLLAETQQ